MKGSGPRAGRWRDRFAAAREALRGSWRRPERAFGLALALLLLAALMPRVPLARDTWSTIVAFDITQSMNVEDYEIDGHNVSRLEFARYSVERALRDLPCGSRVGWAAFAEYRTLLLVAPVEVCEHYGDLVAALHNIDGRMRWANASEITKGVFWSIRAAKAEASHSDVVFITDGHEAPAMQGEGPSVFDDVRESGIHGWILGTGGDALRPIPMSDEDNQPIGYWQPGDILQPGQDPDTPTTEHLSSLHDAHLRKVARLVNFDYARLDSATTLARAMSDPRLSRRLKVPVDLAWIPGGLALVVLCLRFLPRKMPGWRQRREVATS